MTDPRPLNPYPGLRPFREDEEALFFGREAQVDAMVDKLAATHFLAVVGTSGSGKSSLVNCGLIPALHRGLMESAGSGWRMATMRPGNQPLRALAQALAQPAALPQPAAEELGFTPAEFIDAKLRIGKLGLVDTYRESLAPDDTRRNLLLVVDQFEELFRFQALAAAAASSTALARAAEEATAFVNLLLEAAAHPELPVYVVLTMRSDFLGDCAQFFGLPEAINRGQYLVPRLTRDERRAAIEGPARVGGALIDPVLLTRLVNDVGDNPDQLSILQHALNRTWARFQQEARTDGVVTLAHYEHIGTMAGALNLHADEALQSLPEGRPRLLAEQLFKAITDRGTDARGVRRPTRVDTVCAIVGASLDELAPVVEVFRDPSRSFLMPPAGTPLTPDTVLDISHESLMRVWDRLRTWGEQEARSAQTYRRLAESARLHAAGEAALLQGPELAAALDWQQKQKPSPAWAVRYSDDFGRAMAYLDASDKQRAEAARIEARRAMWRRVTFVLMGVLVVPSFAAIYAMRARDDALKAADRAEQALKREADARSKAEHEREQAQYERSMVDQAQSEIRRLEDAQRIQLKAIAAKPATAGPATVVAQAEQATKQRPLIYMQFGDAGQRSLAERLQKQLSQGNYQASGTELVKVAPQRTEVRYFADSDKAAANDLAAKLKAWRFDDRTAAVLVPSYAQQAQVLQLEVWLQRSDANDMAALVQRMRGPDMDDRRAAFTLLTTRYSASTEAITAALAALAPDRFDQLIPQGRYNMIAFLAQTAPLAWSPEQEALGRRVLMLVDERRKGGTQLSGDTLVQLQRLAEVLDAAHAGKALPGGK